MRIIDLDCKTIHCYNCGKEIKHGDTINVVPYDERVFCCVYCLADSYGGIEVDSSMDDYNTYFDLVGKRETIRNSVTFLKTNNNF